MKKLLLPMVGLVVGLVAGTGYTVATHEPPPATEADSTAHDTDGVHDASPDSTGGADHAPGSDHSPAADHGPGATADSASGHGRDAAGMGDGTEANPAAADGSQDESGFQQVQRVTGEGGAGPAATPDRKLALDASLDEAANGPDGADQLAEIFGAMQPKDAAQVLAHLEDEEIREILSRMGVRQAAAVLSNMDADRAAVLSRSVLGGAGGT